MGRLAAGTGGAHAFDAALALLPAEVGDDDTASAELAEPLPVLLERVDRVLASASLGRPVLRCVVSLGWRERAVERLLGSFPNVVALESSADGLASPAALGDRAIPAEDILRARRAALDCLLEMGEGRGRDVVMLVDALGSDAGFPFADPESGGSDRAVAGAILCCHPLRSFLLARSRAGLPFVRPTLETYAEACLAFIERFAELPRFRLEDVASDPQRFVMELGRALRLTLPLEPLPAIHHALDAHDPGVLHYPDGTVAIDEPLDAPGYLRLCTLLGYDPAELETAKPARQRQPNSASGPPARPLPPRRPDREASRLGRFLPVVSRLIDGSANPGPQARFRLDTAALVERIEDCIGHPDGTLEALDRTRIELHPRDAALVHIGCAAHFEACGHKLHALSLLAETESLLRPDDRALRLLAAGLLLRMGRAGLALSMLTADAFAGHDALDPQGQDGLRTLLASLSGGQAGEHGHALLLSRLAAEPPPKDGRRRVMIEIGTTRESVPGQGSTEKLAARCAELGIDFITVDMDPRNSAAARRMFRVKGYPSRAVTAKGEDFLAEWQGVIDYCFLDAYDFDHGQHSELRQSRYEAFLGERINDEACHRMHFDCATSLIAKLSPSGLICFDDTWLDGNGLWTAKGKTAMPLLLHNGFRVLEARNRAALLARG